MEMDELFFNEKLNSNVDRTASDRDYNILIEYLKKEYCSKSIWKEVNKIFVEIFYNYTINIFWIMKYK